MTVGTWVYSSYIDPVKESPFWSGARMILVLWELVAGENEPGPIGGVAPWRSRRVLRLTLNSLSLFVIFNLLLSLNSRSDKSFNSDQQTHLHRQGSANFSFLSYIFVPTSRNCRNEITRISRHRYSSAMLRVVRPQTMGIWSKLAEHEASQVSSFLLMTQNRDTSFKNYISNPSPTLLIG